ncbi:MAG TPA: ATP-grasp domain-containing protein [Polyangia bacterium]|nr:ATP-grasp domain-containing protein [Polyangia bacterium]
MGHSRRLCIAIVHNRDFSAEDDPEFASRADVENAARDIARALTDAGHDVTLMAAPDDCAAAAQLVADLQASPPDLVFNLCESLAGDARHETLLPSLLELAGIAYSGSGPLALGTALRKDRCKAILRAHGVPTPAGFVSDGKLPPAAELPPFPLIVKPSREDASTGIWLRSVVHDVPSLAERVREIVARYRQPALVEPFIVGRELYVSLVGNGAALEALPMHEVDFSAMPGGAPAIVTYDGKWDPASQEYKGTRSIKAEQLDDAMRARCHEVARAAFRALELRDYARVDLRLDGDGVPWVIDVNPNCDLSDGAGVCRAASFGGLTYRDLIVRVVAAAMTRHQQESPHVVGERAASPKLDARQALAIAGAGAGVDSPAAAARSRAAASAVDEGRTVHARGGLGRARADRRRAR